MLLLFEGKYPSFGIFSAGVRLLAVCKGFAKGQAQRGKIKKAHRSFFYVNFL